MSDVTSPVAESVTPKANVTSVLQINISMLNPQPVKVVSEIAVSVLTEPDLAALLAKVKVS